MIAQKTEPWRKVAASKDNRCQIMYLPEYGYRLHIQAGGRDIWEETTLKKGLEQIKVWNKNN